MPSPGRSVRLPSKGTVAVALAGLALVLELAQLGIPSQAAQLITGKDVKNGSITGKDVKNGSLSARDFAAGGLPTGATGPTGPQGVQGPKGDQGVPGPQIVDHVLVLASSFSPQTITVPVGTTVTWFWDSSGFAHNVVADDGTSFTSGSSALGPKIYLHRFDVVGTFGYYCSPHGGPGVGQFGTVVVTPS